MGFRKIILLLLLLIGSNVIAKKIIIGFEAIDYYPQYGVNPVNSPIGFAYELFNLYSKYSEFEISYEAFPVPRLYKGLLSGKVDLKYPDRPDWNTKTKKNYKMIYSNNICRYIDGTIVSLDRKNITLKELKIVGTVRGFTPIDYLSFIKSGDIKIKEYNSAEEVIKSILTKKIGAGYLNINVAKHIEKSKFYSSEISFTEKLPHSKSFYLLSTIDKPKIIEEFNHFLDVHSKHIVNLKRKFDLPIEIE